MTIHDDRAESISADLDRILNANALERRAEELIAKSYAKNSLESFGSDERNWFAVTARYGLDSTLPATAEQMAKVIAAMADEGYKPDTLGRAIVGFRYMHRKRGLAMPETRLAWQVIKGYRRERAEAGIANSNPTPPLEVDDLRRICARLVLGDDRSSQEKALVLLGFALAARVSELANLRWRDMEQVTEGLIITIRMSKVDQNANGAKVAVPWSTDPATCAARSLLNYREVLNEERDPSWTAPEAPMFARLYTSWGNTPTAEPREHTRETLSAQIERIIRLPGDPKLAKLSAHSLRAGFATAAYIGGARELDIARHGRWADNSPVLSGYIHRASLFQENPLGKTGL